MQTQGLGTSPAEQPIETLRLLLISVTEAMLDADRKGSGLDKLLGAIVPKTWPPEFWDQSAIDYLYARQGMVPLCHAEAGIGTTGADRRMRLHRRPRNAGRSGDRLLDPRGVSPSWLRHGGDQCAGSVDLYLQQCAVGVRADLSAPRGIDRSSAQMRIRPGWNRQGSGYGAFSTEASEIGKPLHSIVKSAKTKPSCCSTTPGTSEIGCANMGPA
jgi:hypothetical protein